MNAYEGMMRIIKIDGEMQGLGNQLSKATNITEKEMLNKRINALDIEFITLKHSLELTDLKLVDYNKIVGGK